jgi:xanthine dehydrogenase small subunit
MSFPRPPVETKINFEKISKRKCLDIATVNSAIKITVSDNLINDVGLAIVGVAPIPLFMKRACAFLLNKELSVKNINKAADIAQEEISPISDIRGSADYKRLLVRQLMIAHFTKLFPERMKVIDFYEAY